jgi:ribonuclease D
MSYIYLEEASQADALAEELRGLDRLALDCEAAGFHRYSDRLCLIQLTTPTETYVIDPLGFDPTDLLRAPLEDPDVEIVMHGADFDLRLLDRDLNIRLAGLFDTQVAASLLGASQLGLAALLETHFGVKLSKKFQRADWAERPLTGGMLDYAASDTLYLTRLADILAAELDQIGRTDWAEEECRALEANALAPAVQTDEVPDPVLRVKKARDLNARHITALREALQWRDAIAKRRDRATFRVVGDPPLLEAVALFPRDTAQLADIQGFPGGLARSEGKELLKRLHAVSQMPEEELRGYPKNRNRGPGRPPPEVEAVAERLKAARNQRADELGLDRGTLMSNGVITAIAVAAPGDAEALASVEGVRKWQIEAVGSKLLEVLGSTP